MNIINDIDQNDLCIGCGICESIFGNDNLSVELESDGFYHPKILKETEDLEKVKDICPGLTVDSSKLNKGDKKDFWGNYFRIYRGYAKDQDIRFAGSSGGALTGTLQYLLHEKIVNGIIEVGRDENDPFRNISKLIENKNHLIMNCGSRYSPSKPLAGLVNQLEFKGDSIAVVGKPCDISAVRKYIEFKLPNYHKIKILLSFFCAGTPSLNATDKVLDELGADKKNIKEFWYRGKGWPGFATAIDAKGDEYKMSYHKSWGKILGRDLYHRCKICADGTGRLADITFADAWRMSDGKPIFDESEGYSLIITRSELGEQIISGAKSKSFLDLYDYNPKHVRMIQKTQYLKTKVVLARMMALKLAGKRTVSYRGFNLFSNTFFYNPLEIVKNFLGMLKRILVKKG